MMQHVATAKSEIAAFATGQGASPSQKSVSNEQFGQLLQEQNSDHSLAVAPAGPPPHSPSKKALQQSLDEIEKDTSSKAKETKSKLDKSTSIDNEVNYAAQTSSSSQNNNALQSATQDNASDKSVGVGDRTQAQANDESIANNLSDELLVGKTDAELILSQYQNDIKTKLTIESTSTVAQEWVTLVDNLQKLANIARLTKTPSVDDEVKSQDVSAVDLTLTKKTENRLLVDAVEQQIIGNVNVVPDQTSLRKTTDVGDENVNKEGLASFGFMEKNQSSLAQFMQQALEKLTAEGEIDQVSSANIQQKTAELLLEQPAVLQNFISQLQRVSQKSGAGSEEQKTLDIIKDNVIEKAPLLADQQSKTDGQLDLTLAQDKALLKALVLGSETDIGAQDSIKLVKPVLSHAPENLVQAQQTETLIPKLEFIAERSELLEQDIQMAKIEPNNIINSNKTEILVNNNDIKNILNLTDNKLDKVLENIAQRVLESKNLEQPLSQEQIAKQAVLPKVAEIISSIDSTSKDFISALKSGLDEFKNQLSQGREPGMDLKALIAEALAKTSDTVISSKHTLNLEQMVNSVSQVLDFAQTMNRAIEHHHDQTYSASLRDVAQIQGEQSKQIQLNQFESKFEKAINIAKPDGHQQLAEKVRWMVNTKNLVAEIRLDPAELGSVHVKVTVSGETATVNFMVQSQQARDAVDNATPRLRELLADKGIELGQSSVRQESDGQQDQSDSELARQGGHDINEVEDVEVPTQVLGQQNIVNGALGGIDYFV